MQFANLDMTVRRSLLEKGLPIHWYAEYLFHQAAAIRELNQDSLQLINTSTLSLNNYFAADLPEDFVDDVGAYIAVGNLLHPVPKRSNITPLRATDNTGAFTPYTEDVNFSDISQAGITPSTIWYWNVNDYGEPTGRYFGVGGGDGANGYQIFKERRQIQFTESFTADSVTLIYISNGQSVDNATQIDWAAFAAIQAYSEWKRSPNANFKDSGEARTYYNERRLLRARLNGLTVADIKNILRTNYRATIKN